MGSRAITTPHYLTTVQLTRVAGGGHFYAVWRTCPAARRRADGAESSFSRAGGRRAARGVLHNTLLRVLQYTALNSYSTDKRHTALP